MSVAAAGSLATERRSGLGAAYWRLWTATTASSAGDGLLSVALPLAAATRTRNAAAVALVLVAQRLPWAVCSVPAGAVADRVNRAKLMVTADLGRGAVLGVAGLLAVTGHLNLAVLYATAFALGSLETLFSAASMAAVPAVVAEDELDRANGWLLATQFSGEELLGPAAGGIVFAVMPAAPFIADATSFVSSALLLRRLGPLFSTPTRGASTSLRRDMREGVAFLRRSATLRLLASLTSCYAGCQAMVGGVLVVFALRVLHLTAGGYGLLMAFAAIGNVAGAAAAPRLRRHVGAVPLLLAAGVLAACSYLLMPWSASAVTVCMLIVVECVAVAVGNVVGVTLRQRAIPGELQGRVGNAFRCCVFSSAAAGAALGGVMAAIFGVRAPFAVAGVVQLVAVAALSHRLLIATRPAHDHAVGMAFAA